MSKKCRCNIISFGHINLYILLIILGAIFKTLKEILIASTNLNSKGPEKQHPVIITINYALGLCLSFILFIIYKIYNKENKKTNNLLLDKMIHSLNKEITKKEKFLWILYGSIFDFFANLLYAYEWIKDKDYLCVWPTNLFIMSLFSYLFLKMKLYRHHYLSIIIITIFSIVYNGLAHNFESEKLKKNYKGHIIYFSSESIFNMLYVLYKFFMIKKFIKSYEILSFQGLIEFILGIIILAITTICYPKLDDFNTYREKINESGLEKAMFCLLIFINFLTFLTIFIILDIFTPFHILLLNILSDILYEIIIFIRDVKKKDIETKIAGIIYCILIIISIFMVLVFIEIIQLNFCGLSRMTKKNIEERAKLDVALSNDDDYSNNVSNINSRKISLINEGNYQYELKEFNTRKISQISSFY